MNPDLHDPAAWPLTPEAKAACSRIQAHLGDLGWRALHEAPTGTYPPERIAAYADPSALARLELRPHPDADGQVTVRLIHLNHPVVTQEHPAPDWQADFDGPRLDPDAALRAAHAAPGPRRYEGDPIILAVREHGWHRLPHHDEARYTRALSPDGRRELTYGPYDALFGGKPTPAPWRAAVTDAPGQTAWTLTAASAVPVRVLIAALLETRPATDLPTPPQHHLYTLLTAHGFTPHPWVELELNGTNLRHLADAYLRPDPTGEGTTAVIIATPGYYPEPECEVAAFSGEADLHEILCARTRQAADRGHATFSRHTPPQALLAYVSALTPPPGPAPATLSRALIDACLAETRTDQQAHPAWARAAAETYAAFTLYRPDQRNLEDPEAVEMIAGDLVSDLLHLADTAAVPGPRHDLLDDAYQCYLAVREDPDQDGGTHPAAPTSPEPDDASRTSAHP